MPATPSGPPQAVGPEPTTPPRAAPTSEAARPARPTSEPASPAEAQRLASLLEEAPGLIARLAGPTHVLELANNGFRQAFGQRELLARPIREALPELAGQFFFERLDEVYHTGEPFRAVEMPIRLDRTNSGKLELGYYHFTSQALRDAAGTITGVLVFASDVTEQVLARRHNEALQAELLALQQHLLREREASNQVFEQTPAVVALLRGPQHRIEFYNAAFQRLFPGRELRGRPMGEVAPETANQGFVDLLDGVYHTGATYFGTELPLLMEQPDGQPPKIHHFNFTYQRFEEDGQPAGISVFAYDVAEQVLARQERDTQQRQQQALFEQAPVAMGVFAGPEYVVEVCNPGLQAIWGRTAAQALHRPLLDVLPEIRDQGFIQLLDNVRRTGEPFVAHEMLGQVLHNGQPRAVHLNFVYHPLRDAQGHITAVAAVATDVSEQVAARQQLAQANAGLTASNEQLVRTNANLDTFIYTASHDLRQPIANIEGLLYALREHLGPVVVAETGPTALVARLLDMMQGAVDRFQLTIAQLTDITRLQQVQTAPAETVSLAGLVAALRLDLAPLLASHGGTRLTTDVAACPEVSFAPQHLRSIVYNLLSNAVKYRHPDRSPVVQLRCRSTPTAVVLEVQDNGLGLTPDQQTRLFGMFVRLHDHVEGSGIGLYMVKKIVENAGGTVSVSSQSDVGSIFTITLPT